MRSKTTKPWSWLSLSTTRTTLVLLVVVTVWNATGSIRVIDALAGKKKGRPSNPRGNGGGGGFGKQSSSSSSPLSMEEVVSTFTNRQHMMDSTVPCPCGTNQGGRALRPLSYPECCLPWHDGIQPCTTPLDVLRTRYTAFVYRHIPHILATTHESNRDWRKDRLAWAKDLDREGMFDSMEFVKLEILDCPEMQQQQQQEEQQGGSENNTKDDGDVDGNSSWIEFQVTLRGREDTTDTTNNNNSNSGGSGGDGTTTTGRSVAKVAGLETIIKERSRFLKNPVTGVWSYAGGHVTSQVAGLEDSKLNP